MDAQMLNEFIKPELLVLVPVVYIVGVAIKKTDLIADKYIPVMLGLISIALSTLYVLTTSGICCHGVFTSLVQGILIAGATTYVNQIDKQLRK